MCLVRRQPELINLQPQPMARGARSRVTVTLLHERRQPLLSCCLQRATSAFIVAADSQNRVWSVRPNVVRATAMCIALCGLDVSLGQSLSAFQRLLFW